MSILLRVLLFHLKKKTFEWMVEFFFYFLFFFLIEKTLLLVQLLAIDKIGSTKQTFSQIISFFGGHFVGRID